MGIIRVNKSIYFIERRESNEFMHLSTYNSAKHPVSINTQKPSVTSIVFAWELVGQRALKPPCILNETSRRSSELSLATPAAGTLRRFKAPV